jgi:hypothetical protein
MMTRALVAPAAGAILFAAASLIDGGAGVRAEDAAIRLADIPPREQPPALRPSDGLDPAEPAVEAEPGHAPAPPAAVPAQPAKEPPTDWALYVVGVGVVLALIAGLVRGARNAT